MRENAKKKMKIVRKKGKQNLSVGTYFMCVIFMIFYVVCICGVYLNYEEWYLCTFKAIFQIGQFS